MLYLTFEAGDKVGERIASKRSRKIVGLSTIILDMDSWGNKKSKRIHYKIQTIKVHVNWFQKQLPHDNIRMLNYKNIEFNTNHNTRAKFLTVPYAVKSRCMMTLLFYVYSVRIAEFPNEMSFCTQTVQFFVNMYIITFSRQSINIIWFGNVKFPVSILLVWGVI